MTQLDMFATAPEIAPEQVAPPDLKLLPVKRCCDLKSADAGLDEAIADLALGWPRIDCSGAHYIADPLAIEMVKILRGMPPVISKKQFDYASIEVTRREKLASFRYDGNRIHVRLNVERIVELGQRKPAALHHGHRPLLGDHVGGDRQWEGCGVSGTSYAFTESQPRVYGGFTSDG